MIQFIDLTWHYNLSVVVDDDDDDVCFQIDTIFRLSSLLHLFINFIQ